MPFDLSHRIVLIAGFALHDADAIAAQLAMSGAQVVVAADNEPVEQRLAEVVSDHGRLDAFVYAAMLEQTGDATGPGYRAALSAATAAGRLMAAAGQGVVVTVTAPTDAVRPALQRLTGELCAVLAEGIRLHPVSTAVAPVTSVGQLLNLLIGSDAAALHGQTLTLNPNAPAAAAPALPPSESAADAVVVVGMGVAVPGASSPEEFWKLLQGGRPVFREPDGRFDLDTMWSGDPTAEDRTYSRVAGFMTGFQPHPRLRQEISDGVFDSTEYTALWLRHCILQARQDVAVRPEDRQFLAVGLTPDGSQHLEQSMVKTGVRGIFAAAGEPLPTGLDALYPLGSDPVTEYLPYRIARLAAHDLPESAEISVIDTACSSSLYTIDLGARALRAGETDLALCGGALALQVQSLVLFSKLRGLSTAGSVRALDREADGVLFSDGAAMLALKLHSRAVADGDPILGFVAGFGGSSDGRGKAIYTPNAAGQLIALNRARSAAEVAVEDIDWIVAHATGTPAGDKTEMTALTQSAAPGTTWTMTSNKSVVGHSGWAAGAVSAVHALLAMRHQVIPPQAGFQQVPDGFAASINVPTAELPWPHDPDRRRVVGVSAMGFGGTNGHLILTDRPAAGQRPKPVQALAEPVVVVAHGVHLPDEPGEDRMGPWLAGGAADWPATFGDSYPIPSPTQARLAPSALLAMDRTQLMAMHCADLISGEWVKDDALSERTGVIVAHSGSTRSAMGYDLRCYLSDLQVKLTGPAGVSSSILGDAVRAMVPQSNEDSYPGLMPNVIAARVAQRLDVHGPNMTVDAGRDSMNSAIATAVRYLRENELDLVVVMGINTVLPFAAEADGHEIGEVAIGFVLTRQSVAVRLRMPVLGRIELAAGRISAVEATPAQPDGRDYRGAHGAVALLRSLHSPAVTVAIDAIEDGHTPTVLVATGSPRADVIPTGSGLRANSSRHALALRPVAGRQVREPVSAIPAGALVLTDDPQVLVGRRLPSDCLVISPGPAPRQPVPGVAVRYLDDAQELAGLIAADGRQFGQVRVIVTGQRWPVTAQLAPRVVLDLHDLGFVAAQCCAAALDRGGCYAVLELDCLDGRTPLPYAGLFGGMVRSLQQELPGCQVFALGTDSRPVETGLAELAAESAFHRHLPVVYQAAGVRLELMLLPVEEPAPDQDMALPADPVILATGGARGLTARLVSEVVAAGRPRSLWLLGAAPAPAAAEAAVPLADRAQALRVLMKQHPSEKVAALNARYDRAVQEQQRLATISALEAVCGAGRVHYRQCDMLDEHAVRRTVDEILISQGRIDVVLHGAGLARTSTLAGKKLTDFQTVRDVKVLGYANLRAALADQQPQLWVSVSSVSAFTPLRGELDYGAANEFLLLAAAHARGVNGRDEVALCSGLWTESGMASADTPGGAFLAKQAEIGQLTDEQGREFFRTELRGRGSHGLATTWIGDNDWRTLQRRAPGLQAACLATAESAPEPRRLNPHRSGRRAFLSTVKRDNAARATTWTFEVEIESHPYLLNHLVDDRPTMPGTFILEMAVEAAAELVPDLIPSRITDVVLSNFIRAPRNRWPRTVQVRAVRDGDQVRVRVMTPAWGQVPEREHSRMVVHLDRSLRTGSWWPPTPAGGDEAPNTYQIAGTTVELSGIFGALRLPRLLDDGGAAELRLGIAAGAGPFTGFLLPSLALDCMLRTAVLDGRRPGTIPVMVPTTLSSLELFTAANDLELAQAWPDGLILRHRRDPVTGQKSCAVVAPDGRALIEAVGIAGVDKGVFDTRRGTWQAAVPYDLC